MPPEKRLNAHQSYIADANSVLKVLTLNTGTWVQIEMFSGVDDQNYSSMRHRAAGGAPFIIVDTTDPPGANAIDIGPPAFPLTWYYLYLIGDSSGVLPVAGLLSQQIDAPYGPGPVYPPGYDIKRRVGAVRTDAGGALLEFRKFGQFALYDQFAGNLVYSGNIPAALTPVVVSNYVPATAERCLVEVELWDAAGVGVEFINVYSETIGPAAVGPTFNLRAATSFPGVTQINTGQGWVHTGGNIYILGTGVATSLCNIYVLGYWEDQSPAI